jgi:hypothetical protein
VPLSEAARYHSNPRTGQANSLREPPLHPGYCTAADPSRLAPWLRPSSRLGVSGEKLRKDKKKKEENKEKKRKTKARQSHELNQDVTRPYGPATPLAPGAQYANPNSNRENKTKRVFFFAEYVFSTSHPDLNMTTQTNQGGRT